MKGKFMAVNKKTTNKKTLKQVQGDIVKEETKLTAEDKILGAKPEIVTKTIYNYENPDVKYKVTNLQVKNTPVYVTGDVVETFIGNRNKNARYALKEGAKEVITKDLNGDEIYKIEVVG